MTDTPDTQNARTDLDLGSEPAVVNPSGRRWRPSRRGFLIGIGVVGAGLALGVAYGVPYARLQVAGTLDGADGPPASVTEDPWAWFEVLPDSRIRLYLMKVEMGQGVHTALPQIAAEELGIPWDDLEVVQASTGRDMGDALITSGSNSVSSLYLPLRQAAATLREMLRVEAAQRLQVSPDQLVVSGRSFALESDPTQRIDFGPLVAGKVDWETPNDPVPLKDWREFTVIGQPLPRKDILGKVTGEAVYGYDVRLEGMKYGAVLRPPTLEARLTSAEPGAAAEMPGVVVVVVEDGFAGVVADSRPEAWAAIAQLEATWDEGKLWQQEELEALVSVGDRGGIVIQDVGDAVRVLGEETTLSAEYRTPFAVHAHLEAQAALADVQPDLVRIWSSTQAQGLVRSQVAEALGVAEELVEVQPTLLGGGFGRKAGHEAAVEAALLSRTAGCPVHVGWSREEDMRYGYFRPATHHELSGRVDESGQLVALEHRQASGDVAFGFLPKMVELVMGADFGAYRGAIMRYAVPNRRTVAWRAELPVRTGWWRGLGLLANIFAVESFVDELAYAAGANPLAFRLRHLDDEDPGQRRMKAVLEAAADAAGWETPLAPGHARGLATSLDVDTAVAMVAEISLDNASGKLRVHKVSAAVDPGLAINPDGARAQVEGNVMWGVGSALIEELTIKDGQVVPANFDRYPLLRMNEAPQVEVILLEAGDGKPRGLGEPPIGPVAAAIANAFFALTGVRMRQLPLTPERIMAALAQRETV